MEYNIFSEPEIIMLKKDFMSRLEDIGGNKISMVSYEDHVIAGIIIGLSGMIQEYLRDCFGKYSKEQLELINIYEYCQFDFRMTLAEQYYKLCTLLSFAGFVPVEYLVFEYDYDNEFKYYKNKLF